MKGDSLGYLYCTNCETHQSERFTHCLKCGNEMINKEFIMPEFKNESGLDFADIFSEEYREYIFTGKTIRIDLPLKLNVSASGGHRVFDASGISHYIPAGWLHLQWRVKDGKPNFVK